MKPTLPESGSETVGRAKHSPRLNITPRVFQAVTCLASMPFLFVRVKSDYSERELQGVPCQVLIMSKHTCYCAVTHPPCNQKQKTLSFLKSLCGHRAGRRGRTGILKRAF